MTNYKKTLSIGIFAYNEEKTIVRLLPGLLKQNDNNYLLDSIVVFSDGSSDNTNKILKEFAKNNSKIRPIIYTTRKGKVTRLNQFYKNSKTDLIITLDADISLYNLFVVFEIVRAFSDEKVGIVNTNALPLKPVSLIEKAVVAYEMFWKKTTDNINNGNNIHNSLGCMIGLSKDFYADLQIPQNIVAEDHFLYLEALRSGFQCKYAKLAKIYFRCPQTVSDFLYQSTRYHTSRADLEKYFGAQIDSYYEIPKGIKIKAYIHTLLKRPIYFFYGILLQIVQRVYASLNSQPDHKLWKVIHSSK